MVDEPELNLHPANQRRIARLFARLGEFRALRSLSPPTAITLSKS